jgi:hypothetical protein
MNAIPQARIVAFQLLEQQARELHSTSATSYSAAPRSGCHDVVWRAFAIGHESLIEIDLTKLVARRSPQTSFSPDWCED